MAAFRLRSFEFRKEREKSWRELDALVSVIERKGLRAISSTKLARLPVLHRAAVSSLSVARSISLDKNLIEYLETLTSRSYVCVYGPRQRVIEAFRRFLMVRFPCAVRRFRWYVLAAALVLVASAAGGWAATAKNPELYDAIMPGDLAAGRGLDSSREDLESVLFGGDDRSFDQLFGFSAQLFTHNSQVGMLSFALGFLVALPTFLLTIYNGLMLGTFSALHAKHGLTVELYSWLLPHGVTELLALVLCSAAGFAIGIRVVFPGRYRRLQALADTGKDAAWMVLGSVAMLLLAGLIEGIFRQWVQSMVIRYVVAAATAIFWAFFFIRAGRRETVG